MANLAEKLGLDEKVSELKLGSSFDGGQPIAYHSIRYDFKPASVDTTQVASVDVGEKNSVTVTLPHIEGSGTAHTVYKGNKRQCQKECVLIIDHSTGEITLEKLANNIQLKKTRVDGSSKASIQLPRPHTPTEKIQKASPAKKIKPVATTIQLPVPTVPSVPQPHQGPPAMKKEAEFKESSPAGQLDLMSCSDSDSDSDSDTSIKAPQAQVSQLSLSSTSKTDYNVLNDDLNLSDSSSDSD